MPIFNPITKWLAGILVFIAIISGVALFSYNKGVQYQKGIIAEAIQVANEKVVEKNTNTQEVADVTEKTQIEYRDRIITKYQVINKEVIKYEKTEAADVFLDPEFVRLHNIAAATNDQVQIAEPSSRVDGKAQIVGVTTGEAIGTISRNYEQYQLCAKQIIGWQEFYVQVQSKIAE